MKDIKRCPSAICECNDEQTRSVPDQWCTVADRNFEGCQGSGSSYRYIVHEKQVDSVVKNNGRLKPSIEPALFEGGDIVEERIPSGLKKIKDKPKRKERKNQA
jgi:hypothetical protein